MKHILILLAALLLGTGCQRTTGPAPVALEQLPEVLAKAFATAPPALKKNVDGLIAQLGGKQYAAVSLQIPSLLSDQTLTPAQREALSAAAVTVSQVLQEQAAALSEAAPGTEGTTGATPGTGAPVSQDDAAAAAAALDFHIRTK